MLVRVADPFEAAAAAAAGVDAIEMRIAEPIDLAMLRAVRLAFTGTLRIRSAGVLASHECVAAAAMVGAEEVALPLAADASPADGAKLPPELRAVAILDGPDLVEAVQRVRGGADFVMLEADGTRLMDAADIATLDAFAFACRAAGLPFGLSGGLEAPDVARLLLLEPDMLGFDIAVRRHHRADQPLDGTALAAIRALIPREGDTAAARAPSESVVDCVFVRDFAVSLSIGAYQAEHGTRQRVRFSVDADVVRKPLPPHDMREIFSYDVIIETIRVLSQRPHVTFVETLAEEVAAALLTHADLVAVKVKVEKLDVVDGAVGIEIVRRRQPASLVP
jgi:dihydroneopterin aldolase